MVLMSGVRWCRVGVAVLTMSATMGHRQRLGIAVRVRVLAQGET